MRRPSSVLILLCGYLLAGCGGQNISVTGVLLKGGAKYTPPEGRKLALYFIPMDDGTPSSPARDTEMALYNESDGTFTVPGRDGLGIIPGKYRISLSETLLRETLDQILKSPKPTINGKKPTRDTNLLEDTFGATTSPFIRDLKTSTDLTLDMTKPSE